VGERFLAVAHQKLVEVRIRARDCRGGDRGRDGEIVDRGPELDLFTEETDQFLGCAEAGVDELHPLCRDPLAGELPDHPQLRGHQSLGLMPVEVAAHPDEAGTRSPAAFATAARRDTPSLPSTP
jgi:hypothetical protein